MSAIKSERWIVGTVGAVQFMNVLDFMMVMPLGPDYAQDLGIPTSKLGWVGGSYTLAAGVAGLLASFFIDRFDRKRALIVAMMGLTLGTLLGGLSQGFITLLLSRLLAGMFGGPASALSYSIIADVVPVARRGRAMGAVMGAFSLASVFGVPAGLEFARLGGWKAPFFAVAAACTAVTGFAIWALPSLRGHIKQEAPSSQSRALFVTLLKRPEVRLSYTLSMLVMLGNFMMIPNFSAFFQFNLGFPRSSLGTLYLIGGVLSFFGMRLAGRWIDRAGSFRVSAVSTVVMMVIIVAGYVYAPPLLPPTLIFVGFMLGTSSRNVSIASLTSRVPDLSERAGFMSLQSAVQHFSCAAGAFLSAAFLSQSSNGALIGMPKVAMVSVMMALIVPFMLRLLERKVLFKESKSVVQGVSA